MVLRRVWCLSEGKYAAPPEGPLTLESCARCLHSPVSDSHAYSHIHPHPQTRTATRTHTHAHIHTRVHFHMHTYVHTQAHACSSKPRTPYTYTHHTHTHAYTYTRAAYTYTRSSPYAYTRCLSLFRCSSISPFLSIWLIRSSSMPGGGSSVQVTVQGQLSGVYTNFQYRSDRLSLSLSLLSFFSLPPSLFVCCESSMAAYLHSTFSALPFLISSLSPFSFLLSSASPSLCSFFLSATSRLKHLSFFSPLFQTVRFVLFCFVWLTSNLRGVSVCHVRHGCTL